MDTRLSYYDIALDDYNYFKQVMCANLNFPYYNGLAVQAQQIVEKMLKHILAEFCTEEDNTDTLRSHNLVNIYNSILSQGVEIQMNKEDLQFISNFYYDARIPGNDYIVVTIEDAKRAIAIVDEVVVQIETIKNKNN